MMKTVPFLIIERFRLLIYVKRIFFFINYYSILVLIIIICYNHN